MRLFGMKWMAHKEWHNYRRKVRWGFLHTLETGRDEWWPRPLLLAPLAFCLLFAAGELTGTCLCVHLVAAVRRTATSPPAIRNTLIAKTFYTTTIAQSGVWWILTEIKTAFVKMGLRKSSNYYLTNHVHMGQNLNVKKYDKFCSNAWECVFDKEQHQQKNKIDIQYALSTKIYVSGVKRLTAVFMYIL